MAAAVSESEPKKRRIVDEEEDEEMEQAVVATPAATSHEENFSPELLKLCVPRHSHASKVARRRSSHCRPASLTKCCACTLRYYDRLFPANLMCRWMSYGSQHDESATTQLLHRREFSFTTGDDIYIRYLSYEDAAGLKKDLLAKLPHKIDIGAVFSAAPRDHKKYKLFEPQQREFIIDIDLTDCACLTSRRGSTRPCVPSLPSCVSCVSPPPRCAHWPSGSCVPTLDSQTTFLTSTSSAWRRATDAGP